MPGTMLLGSQGQADRHAGCSMAAAPDSGSELRAPLQDLPLQACVLSAFQLRPRREPGSTYQRGMSNSPLRHPGQEAPSVFADWDLQQFMAVSAQPSEVDTLYSERSEGGGIYSEQSGRTGLSSSAGSALPSERSCPLLLARSISLANSDMSCMIHGNSSNPGASDSGTGWEAPSTKGDRCHDHAAHKAHAARRAKPSRRRHHHHPQHPPHSPSHGGQSRLSPRAGRDGMSFDQVLRTITSVASSDTRVASRLQQQGPSSLGSPKSNTLAPQPPKEGGPPPPERGISSRRGRTQLRALKPNLSVGDCSRANDSPQQVPQLQLLTSVSEQVGPAPEVSQEPGSSRGGGSLASRPSPYTAGSSTALELRAHASAVPAPLEGGGEQRQGPGRGPGALQAPTGRRMAYVAAADPMQEGLQQQAGDDDEGEEERYLMQLAAVGCSSKTGIEQVCGTAAAVGLPEKHGKTRGLHPKVHGKGILSELRGLSRRSGMKLRGFEG